LFHKYSIFVIYTSVAMKTILIVEDEKEIRTIERDYLVNEGFKVLEAEDGKQALDLFWKENVDLVVLDINLPVTDGITVCKRIRSESNVPIIMVTARTQEIDELIGLEVGADDYVKKPFSPKILVARVKSLVKRPEISSDDEILEAKGIRLEPAKQRIIKGKKVIDLTTNQFNLLYNLMRNAGNVLTREDLIERSYDSNLPPDIYDRTIDSHIKNIRKLIERDSKDPKYILTVRGRGYKFNDELLK